ncbi:malonyl-CoA decarboxylase domain-containing protein [Falsiroseomonas sp. HW251]|uniref:malonyl-CoA decarboxylase domain-containing protein n=1 Tax=Falsiroseomonas sp. HW251 TaxID=3390998 RepID=UPI003D317A8F
MAAPRDTDAASWLDRLWSRIGDRGRPAAAAPAERARRLAEALLSERGEASGAALARELLRVVGELSPADRAGFHLFLAEGFDADADALRRAAEAWLATPTPELAASLAEAAEPRRQELLRRMNMAPGGTAALVAMRREVLGGMKDAPRLGLLEGDLRHLLASWFNRGFLELRRIDWHTPAIVLEKLIAYEAVHEIHGWDDLRRRLAPDRRCFGFFHPALPEEPLIFVEVALVEGLATAIAPLLARDEEGDGAAAARARRADTAIFYSISNCQEGLRGISFGNLLIKQVVEELKAELPQLTRFATLSPVPGLRRWAEGQDTPGLPEPDDPWWEDAARAEALRPVLLRLAAAYLTRPATEGRIDPVARFHLGNGARLEAIHFLANLSPRGMRESFGIMVSYLYDAAAIEANHEAFVRTGAVARSAAVEALLARPRRRGGAQP